MNIEEIKRNAPDGATHYECSFMVDYIIDYWKLDSCWYWWHDNKWKEYPFGNANASYDLKPL